MTMHRSRGSQYRNERFCLTVSEGYDLHEAKISWATQLGYLVRSKIVLLSIDEAKREIMVDWRSATSEVIGQHMALLRNQPEYGGTFIVVDVAEDNRKAASHTIMQAQRETKLRIQSKEESLEQLKKLQPPVCSLPGIFGAAELGNNEMTNAYIKGLPCPHYDERTGKSIPNPDRLVAPENKHMLRAYHQLAHKPSALQHSHASAYAIGDPLDDLRIAVPKLNVEKHGNEVLLGASFDLRDQHGKTPLHIAAAAGKTETVKLLLDNGADPNALDREGQTALHMAAMQGHTECLTVLMLRGGRVDIAAISGRTVIHCACMNGHAELLYKMLFSEELSKCKAYEMMERKTFIEGETVLHALCRAPRTTQDQIYSANTAARYLLKAWLQMCARLPPEILDVQDVNGCTALHVCAMRGSTDLLKYICSFGAKPNIPSRNGDLPVHIAVRLGSVPMAMALIAAGSNMGYQNKEGDTPLHIAATIGNKDLFKMCINSFPQTNGVSPFSFFNARGDSAIHITARMCSQRDATGESPFHELVRFAINNRADPLMRNAAGDTPLLCASMSGNDKTVAYLVKLTVEESGESLALPALNDTGESAMLLAARYGHEAVIRELAKLGADVNSKARTGISCLSEAAEAGHVSAVGALLSLGAHSDSRDVLGRTALHWAAKKGHVDVVRMLHSKGGVSPDVCDRVNATPLHLAAEAGQAKVVEALLQYGATPSMARKDGSTAIDVATDEVKQVIRMWEMQGMDQQGGVQSVVDGDQVSDSADWLVASVRVAAAEVLHDVVCAVEGIVREQALLQWRRLNAHVEGMEHTDASESGHVHVHIHEGMAVDDSLSESPQVPPRRSGVVRSKSQATAQGEAKTSITSTAQERAATAPSSLAKHVSMLSEDGEDTQLRGEESEAREQSSSLRSGSSRRASKSKVTLSVQASVEYDSDAQQRNATPHSGKLNSEALSTTPSLSPARTPGIVSNSPAGLGSEIRTPSVLKVGRASKGTSVKSVRFGKKKPDIKIVDADNDEDSQEMASSRPFTAYASVVNGEPQSKKWLLPPRPATTLAAPHIKPSSPRLRPKHSEVFFGTGSALDLQILKLEWAANSPYAKVFSKPSTASSAAEAFEEVQHKYGSFKSVDQAWSRLERSSYWNEEHRPRNVERKQRQHSSMLRAMRPATSAAEPRKLVGGAKEADEDDSWLPPLHGKSRFKRPSTVDPSLMATNTIWWYDTLQTAQPDDEGEWVRNTERTRHGTAEAERLAFQRERHRAEELMRLILQDEEQPDDDERTGDAVVIAPLSGGSGTGSDIARSTGSVDVDAAASKQRIAAGLSRSNSPQAQNIDVPKGAHARESDVQRVTSPTVNMNIVQRVTSPPLSMNVVQRVTSPPLSMNVVQRVTSPPLGMNVVKANSTRSMELVKGTSARGVDLVRGASSSGMGLLRGASAHSIELLKTASSRSFDILRGASLRSINMEKASSKGSMDKGSSKGSIDMPRGDSADSSRSASSRSASDKSMINSRVGSAKSVDSSHLPALSSSQILRGRRGSSSTSSPVELPAIAASAGGGSLHGVSAENTFALRGRRGSNSYVVSVDD